MAMSARRVVVTGMGLVTPLGVGVSHSWPALLTGQSGIRSLKEDPHTSWPASLPSLVAATVPRGEAPGQFDEVNDWSKAQQRQMSLAMKFGLMAADEALADAEWNGSLPEEERCGTGVAVGMAMIDLDYVAHAYQLVESGQLNKVSPYFMPRILPNLSGGHIALKYGFRGPAHAVSTACATGTHAIGDACRMIQHGDANVMVCGGVESCITPLTVDGFCRARALSTRFNDKPAQASRPFDKDRDGFVMAEGAGVLVLEDLAHALNRSAPRIYAEVAGYGLSGDAHHITAGREDGEGALRAMRSACRHIDSLDQLWYVNAHATSTPKGDLAEMTALDKLLDERGTQGHRPHVSSNKGQLGHLLGAAGSVESIMALLSMEHGLIPANANLDHLDEKMPCHNINILRENVSETDSDRKYVLKNSFGFGGTNVSLLFKRLDESELVL